MQTSPGSYCFSSQSRHADLRCFSFSMPKRKLAMLSADICWLLLLQQPEDMRCGMQISLDCYRFSSPNSSDALCRYPLTAIVSAVADICYLLLFQQSKVEQCSAHISSGSSCFSKSECIAHRSAGCYCFSRFKPTNALYRHPLAATKIEPCFLQASFGCYCFSEPMSTDAVHTSSSCF